MKLKYEMSMMEIDGDKMAVPLNSAESFRGVLQFNETAGRIIELLQEETTEEQIVQTLLDEYEATPERIKTNVESVLSDLRKYNLLVEG